MRRKLFTLACGGAGLVLMLLIVAARQRASAEAVGFAETELNETVAAEQQGDYRSDIFDVEVLVQGRTLEQYLARGRRYIEALRGTEYELRIRNPLGVRVAVALSVDGLNTIDARRSSAWNSSKWVIGPYQTITIRGWQMSGDRARRFYFTSEKDSYGAKLGQTNNLGVISAVFFRERSSVGVVTPPRPYEDRAGREEQKTERDSSAGNAPSAGTSSANRAKRGEVYPQPSDEAAATGIGRNVRNDVRWVNLDLDSRPASEVNIRYEYRDALIRLGIVPRPYPYYPDPTDRRERSTGFEERRYSPEP
jgi:hypothetical protein